MKLRSLLVGIVVCFALGAFAPAAMAQDFCVGVTAPRCPVATYGLNLAAFSQAVEDADTDPGADTVVIAPHTFTLADSFSISPAADTTIVGAGVGQTVFAGSVPGEIMLQVSGAGASMSDFSVEVNNEDANGTGLSVNKATVSDFNVFKSNDVFSLGFVGLDLRDGATAKDGTVYVTANAVTAVHASDKSATVERMNIESEPFLGSTLGILADSDDAGATLALRHVTIKTFFTAFSAADMDTTITDSLIDMGPLSFASGIAAGAYGTNTIGLDVARVSIVGKGSDQTAFFLQSDAAPASIDANLYDFVSYTDAAHVSTYETLYCAGGSGAAPSVHIDVEYFASWGGDTTIAPGCSWDLDGTKTINFINDGGPDFRDFAGGDYRLLWTSPLIDAGDTQGSLTSADTDVAGAKRLIDGNGDDEAKPDLGAHEYQRLAPVVSLSASQTTIKPGDEVAFGAAVNDPEGEAFSISWDFGDGATAGNQDSATHKYAAIGSYNAAVTAIDDTGASTTVVKTISVPDPNAIPPRQSPPSTIITSTRVTAKPKKSFKAGKKGFSVAKKGQPSFTLTFENAAKAKFTVQSVGKKKKLKSTKVSTTLAVKDGATKFFFGGGKLKPGKYLVTITPIGASGKVGTPVSVSIMLAE
jgi:PKD repeat protein